jgi:hypothetical protein
LPIVNRHLLGQTLVTAEKQLSDPPGFFLSAMTAKRTFQNSASKERLGTASSRMTSGPELHCLVIRPDSSGGCGSHAKVEAQVGATRNKTTTQLIPEGSESSKGLQMNPNGRGRIDNESYDGGAGEQDVPLRVQAPMAGVWGVGRSKDDDEINLASISFGSDTVWQKTHLAQTHLAKKYVIIDPKVEKNGSLAMESLLEQESAESVMSGQDGNFVEQRVFFPTFTRYFLAKEQSFKSLLKGGKIGWNCDAPFSPQR